MRYSILSGALLLGLTAVAASGGEIKALQPPPGANPPATEPVPVVKLAVRPGSAMTRALKYALLPDPLDLKPGNAAPVWRRAGDAAQGVQRKITEAEDKWGRTSGLPLKELPAREIRDLLAGYATALRLADQAARFDRCDWELPPLTLQDFDLPFDDIQHLRLLANVLGIRFRLELSEGRFDDAHSTLQTGFALARDLGKGDTLIQDLVGIAVGSIMFGHVEEWVQTPGSPNLFWALTDLPAPLINPEHAMRTELTTIYRSFPALRRLARESDNGPMSNEEASRIVADLQKIWNDSTDQKTPDWQQKLGAAALVLKTYPDARKYLLDHRRTAEQLDAMPAVQVVLLYFVDQYDGATDDLLKWLNVAPWEARVGLEKVAHDIRAQSVPGNPIIRLLIPAVEKVYEARVRIERNADTLRVAEALRAYAADHNGKPPEKLDDVKLPLPLDPYTGESFGKLYKIEADGTAVFEVPPPPNIPSLGRRFELAPPR